MVMVDEVSRCAMEVADGIMEEGTEVMLTAILDPSDDRKSIRFTSLGHNRVVR